MPAWVTPIRGTVGRVTEVLVFHHALGLTPGIRSFAERLRDAGHVVHTPDLFEGKNFEGIEEGVGYAEEIGFGTILDRGERAAAALPTELVYAGFSLGVLPAQMLAQTRPGTKGALLFHSAVPPSEFGGPWPVDVPLQIHIMEEDPFALEGDLDVARQLAATVERAELFLYPGDRHLFADDGTPDHDPQASALLTERALRFLDEVG